MTEHSDQLEYENARLRKLLAQAGIEAVAQDVASKLQKLIIAELHHRVKNLLAMVLSIAGQTLRTAPSVEAAASAIQGRIMILSQSFDLLIEEGMDALPVHALVTAAAEPYNAAHRIRIDVPDFRIAALPALSIALVLNELCTNAVKYGALSGDIGMVDVSGNLDSSTLSLYWSERDGPPVQAPGTKSFGTRMIQSIIPEATVIMDFRPTGLVCSFEMPRTSLEDAKPV